MSIAVSVTVQPSRMLLGLCALVCGLAVAVGFVFLAGFVPAVSPIMRAGLALCCFIAAGLGWRALWRGRRAWRLDISGTGQIRLRSDAEKSAAGGGLLVRLLANSTMWPNFLLLRLQDGDGQVHHLTILPDSLPSGTFRAVSVVCRWIAAHRFQE